MRSSYSKYTEDQPIGQVQFNWLPAVALGGPPHSGKSVLAYSLTQTLRKRGVNHYLLRAYPPDGEGDWFLGAEPEQVRHFRIKGAQRETWLPLLKRDIAQRHLPLLVDMGGLPTTEQETILDHCTHGILLTPDAATHAAWHARMTDHDLILLADLHSALTGKPGVEDCAPLLTGTLVGLERGTMATGPAFEALVARLSTLLASTSQGLRRRHLEQAPVELVVDLARLAHHFEVVTPHWPPTALPRILAYLPGGQPLALYGRGPNWLYAAVAAQAYPAPFYLFDARLGWVEAPHLAQGTPRPTAPLQCTQRHWPAGCLLEYRLPDTYLDITEVDILRLPAPRHAGGLILSGKLPLWLWAALARTYHDAPWLAVVQPQLPGAVVIRASQGDYTVGSVLPLL